VKDAKLKLMSDKVEHDKVARCTFQPNLNHRNSTSRSHLRTEEGVDEDKEKSNAHLRLYQQSIRNLKDHYKENEVQEDQNIEGDVS